MKPEVLLFDAAGTLIRLSKPVGEGYAEVARRHGFDPDPEILSNSFGVCWRQTPPPPPEHPAAPSQARIRTGSDAPNDTPGSTPGDDDDERWWWRSLVRQVLRAAGISLGESQFEAYFLDLYAYYGEAGAWEMFDEVPAVLGSLRHRSGYRLAVASNFDRRLHSVLEGHGIAGLFEKIHVSSELRVSKPSPEFFHRIVSASGAAPESHLHIGDDPELDWAAARAAGLQAFELDRSHSDLLNLLQQL